MEKQDKIVKLVSWSEGGGGGGKLCGRIKTKKTEEESFVLRDVMRTEATFFSSSACVQIKSRVLLATTHIVRTYTATSAGEKIHPTVAHSGLLW